MSADGPSHLAVITSRWRCPWCHLWMGPEDTVHAEGGTFWHGCGGQVRFYVGDHTRETPAVYADRCVSGENPDKGKANEP